MALKRSSAIVLRRTNYGEADRILQLLTPEGQKTVMAKGVRREKSKLAGGIELFAITDVVINSGKGDMGTLTSARLVHFYRHILEDYDRMQFGYDVIKHVSKASRMLDESMWYSVLTEVLAGLDALTLPIQIIQTWWYLRYAELMGDELNLQTDVMGKRLEGDKTYMYDVSEKGLRLSGQGEITASHIKYMRLLQAKPISVIAQIGGVDPILPDCWLVSRQHAAL